MVSDGRTKNGSFGPGRMPSPETIRTLPSGSVVVVGYQRPRAMSGPAVPLDVSRLKSLVSRSPTYGSSCPPATNRRPSGSSACPAQKRLIPEGVLTNVPVSGSQTCSDCGAALKASHATTLPLDSIEAWTATSGQFCGAVQLPASSAGVPGEVVAGDPT